MNLFQLIYVSTPDKSLDIEGTRKIVDIAQKNNSASSITGFLCCNSNFFIQCLEGNQVDVEHLFSIISNDKRHHKIMMLSKSACDRRYFPNWSMGVILEMDKHKDILDKYVHEKNFNPYQIDYHDCLNMLVDFSKLKQ